MSVPDVLAAARTRASQVEEGGAAAYSKRPYRRDQLRRREWRRRSKPQLRAPRHDDQLGNDTEAEPAESVSHRGNSVPRTASLGQTVNEANDDNAPITTVMLGNIPCQYTQGSLLRELDEMGFADKCAFFYLPIDTRSKTCVGYALVDFPDPAEACRFLSTFKDYRFRRHQGDKGALVCPARIQGLWNNVRHFSSRAVLHARDCEHRPLVFQNGFRRDIGELIAEVSAASGPAALVVPELVQPPSPIALGTGDAAACQLNPAAKEFVPRPVEGPGIACTFVESGLNANAPAFVPELPCGAAAHFQPAIPDALRLTGPCALEDPVNAIGISKSFIDARREIEKMVSVLLLRGAQTCASGRQRSPSLATEAVGADPPSPTMVSAGALNTMASTAMTGGGWVAEALAVLVDDLTRLPMQGPNADWIAESFKVLVDDIATSPAAHLGDFWVAEAFGALVGSTPKWSDKRHGWQRSMRKYEVQSLPDGDDWVAEAFCAMASGGVNRLANTHITLESPAGSRPATESTSMLWGSGWVSEAFRSLVSGGAKRRSEGLSPVEDMDCGMKFANFSPCSTPKSLTPRLGDAVQRLRSLGGWAWIAFA